MSYQHPQHLNLKLPVIQLKSFDPDDFPAWAHKAQRFFSQYGLWDIVTGKRKNPAGDVEPSTKSGVVDLGHIDLSTDSETEPNARILVGNPDPNKPHEVSVYEWNHQHSLAYNYLMNALEDQTAAYARCYTAKDAAEVWERLQAQYGGQSDARLILLEHKLSELKKTPDTSMKKHIDNFSELIERIQYHLPLEAKWTNLTINQKFFGTLELKDWLPWKRSYGATLKTMLPAELYAQICFDDEIVNPESEKEANAARISNTRGNNIRGGQGKFRGGNRGRNRGKNNLFQPFKYDGRLPSATYVQKMKEKWGADYQECKFCTWPGHTSRDCNSLRDAKAQKTSKQQHQSAGQKSSGNSGQKSSDNSNSNPSNFIPWEATVMELIASATTITKNDHTWGLDSHANVHITPYKHRFVTYHQLEKPERVVGWQGAVDTATGVGSIELVNQKGRRCRLDNVYYAPKAGKQLLSEGKLFMNDGLIRTYSKNANQTGEFVLKKRDGFSLFGKIVNNLYFVFEAKSSHHANAVTRSMINDDEQVHEDAESRVENSWNQPIRNQDSESQPPSPPSTSNEVRTGENVDDAILWHNRLCHRAISTLQKAGIIPKMVQIVPSWCKSCVEGKQTKLPYRPYEHKAKRTLWRVHSDMSGMTTPAAEKSYRYFITFVDDLSRYSWVYFTERKDAKSIAEKYQEWRAEAENKSGNVVSYLQTDEGGEYEKEMAIVLKQSGTTHLTSPPYSHQSNGLAEILNRNLKDSARTMMIYANLPNAFWSKAVKVANEISNMLPHTATGKIPYEVFFDLSAPPFDRYKIFGYIIEPLIEVESRPAQSMWDKRANRQVYVGTDSRSGYEYWDLTNHRFALTHNCTFFENEFPSPDEFPTLRTEPRTRKRARVNSVPPVTQ